MQAVQEARKGQTEAWVRTRDGGALAQVGHGGAGDPGDEGNPQDAHQHGAPHPLPHRQRDDQEAADAQPHGSALHATPHCNAHTAECCDDYPLTEQVLAHTGGATSWGVCSGACIRMQHPGGPENTD